MSFSPRRIGLVAATLVAAAALPSWIVGTLLTRSRWQQRLTARLSQAFGRPIRVGQFRWALWSGLTIQSEQVSVAEDPAFGAEPFLQARRASLHLSPWALLRGKIEITALRFDDVSLNLVEQHGRWNLAAWLGQQAQGAGRTRAARHPLARLEIHHGRINFKRGLDKLPFALVEVEGAVARRGADRWGVELRAAPLRAAVAVQDAGMIRLRGEMGAAAAELLPLRLELEWTDAALADLGRLAFGEDPGWRGRAMATLHVEADRHGGRGKLEAHFSGLHGWAQPPRADDPALFVALIGEWVPAEHRLRLTSGLLATTHSQAQWAGSLVHDPDRRRWQVHLAVSQATLAVADLLRFYRAFRAGVQENLQARGWIHGDLTLSGWPLRIERATGRGDNVELFEPEGRPLLTVSSLTAQLQPGGGEWQLRGIEFPRSKGQLRLEGRLQCAQQCESTVQLRGQLQQFAAITEAVEALGWPMGSPWRQLEGPAAIALRWRKLPKRKAWHWHAELRLTGASWHPPGLATAVRLPAARILADPGRTRIVVEDARLLGSDWRGWLERHTTGGPWKFRLAASEFDAAAVLRLAPRQPLPFWERWWRGNSSVSPAMAWLKEVSANGRISIQQVRFSRVHLDDLQARVNLTEGTLAVRALRAELGGGRLSGSLTLTPSQDRWSGQADFALHPLRFAEVAAWLRSRDTLRGALDVTARFSVRGANLAEIVRGLEGEAELRGGRVEDRAFDWIASLEAGHPVSGHSVLSVLDGRFRLARLSVQGDVLLSAAGRRQIAARGSVALDPPYRLMLQVQLRPPGRPQGSPPEENALHRLTGTLIPLHVQMSRPEHAARR